MRSVYTTCEESCARRWCRIRLFGSRGDAPGPDRLQITTRAYTGLCTSLKRRLKCRDQAARTESRGEEVSRAASGTPCKRKQEPAAGTLGFWDGDRLFGASELKKYSVSITGVIGTSSDAPRSRKHLLAQSFWAGAAFWPSTITSEEQWSNFVGVQRRYLRCRASPGNELEGNYGLPTPAKTPTRRLRVQAPSASFSPQKCISNAPFLLNNSFSPRVRVHSIRSEPEPRQISTSGSDMGHPPQDRHNHTFFIQC